MSDAIALVRFPDGELRAALYFGSTDMVVPVLFDPGEARDIVEGGIDYVMPRLAEVEGSGDDPGPLEEVAVWTSYGAGAHWVGEASRSLGMLTAGIDPYGNASPDDVREVTEVVPDWVPEGYRA